MVVGARRRSRQLFDMSKNYYMYVLDMTPYERSVDAVDGGRSVEGLDDTADGRNSTDDSES